MRTVEFKEPFLIGEVQYVEGDRKALSDELAANLIEVGVAMDPETGEDNERKPGAHRLNVQDIYQPAS